MDVAPDGSTVAPANLRLDLVFDRYLDPRTVQRASVCLRSNAEPVGSFEQCTGAAFLNAAYDPVGRVVSYYVDPGQTPQLLPATTHLLTVHLANEADEIGFRAYDGAPLAQKYELFFSVADPGGLAPQLPPPLTEDDCAIVEGVLESCARCHAWGPDKAPAEGLETSPFEGFGSRAQRVAHGASLGATANQGARRPEHFGAGMQIVTPTDPGNSYLLYKLLAALPADGATLQPDETERIRSELITGLPMPPDNVQDQVTDEGNVIPFRPTEVQLKLVSRWIAVGAPDSCAGLPDEP